MIVMQIIELAATFIEVQVGIEVNKSILCENETKRRMSIVFSLVMALVVWILNQYQLYSVFTSIVAILGIVLSACILYRTRVVDSIILTSFYMIIIYIIDFFSIAFFGVFFQQKQFADLVTTSFSYERICFIVLSKGILYVITYIFMNKWLLHSSTSIRKLWLGILMCIAILYSFAEMTYLQINETVLFLWVLFLLFVILGVYTAIHYLKYAQEKQQMSLMIERAQVQLDSYEKMIQTDLEKQAFYHDLKNHYILVENYLSNEEYDKAKDYMGKLKEVSANWDAEQRTGIRSVDILLDHKIKEAKSYGIDISITSDIVRAKVTVQELITLIGNLMDNAIEACKEMEYGARWIDIAISKNQEMTLMKISNSYELIPVKKSGEFVSTKNNPQAHGLGIKSVKMIVEKYAGKMKTEYSDGVFSVMVLFFE